MELVIRQAKPYDALKIAKLGVCYSLGENRESLASLAPKIAPGECRLAEVGSYVVGYVLALPMRRELVPLQNLNYFPPPNPDCLYIHALCVSHRFQGIGIGSRLVQELCASRYDILSVMALQNSEWFWRKHNFQPLRVVNYFNQPVAQLERRR